MRFAYELLEEEGGLSRRVIRALGGQPRRLAELEVLRAGPGSRALHDTLVRLEADGLIEKRTSQRSVDVFHTFELTPLGAHAEAEMQKMRPEAHVPLPPVPRQPANRRANSAARTRWAYR